MAPHPYSVADDAAGHAGKVTYLGHRAAGAMGIESLSPTPSPVRFLFRGVLCGGWGVGGTTPGPNMFGNAASNILSRVF